MAYAVSHQQRLEEIKKREANKEMKATDKSAP
jgi:hypothetical protein